jgi:hypothetical protein
MNNRETQQTDEEQASERRAGERLTTADMAAAATVPAKSKGNGEDNPPLATVSSGEGLQSLFGQGELEEFRSRWSGIQTEFVDQPRRSVEEADELVAAVMKRLAEVFAAEREKLESEWASGEDVSTEDLRIALRRYRSFFDRLLSV